MKKQTFLLICLLAVFFVFSVGVAAESDFNKINLFAEDDSTSYTVQVKVPANLQISFYATAGFDDDGYDICGKAINVTIGKKTDGFRTYTLEVLNNVDRVSYRATENGADLGGMTFATKDNNGDPIADVITLRRVNGVITTMVDGEAPAADQCVFMVKDNELHSVSGGAAAYDAEGYLYYPYLLVAANNDLVYSYRAVVSGALAEKYVTTFANEKTVNSDSSEVLNAPMALNYKSLYTITCPNGAVAQLYGQHANYNVVKAELIEKKDNGNGTTSWVFSNSMGGAPTYRVSMEGKVTKAGFIAPGETGINIFWKDTDPGPDYRTPYNPETEYYAPRGDDSMMMNVNAMGHLGLAEGDSFRLKLYRIWQIINNDSANWMIEPDFHYEIISGGDILEIDPVDDVNGNATGNWLDLTAKKPGTAFIEFSYDALTVVTCYTMFADDHPLNNYTFRASDPARQRLLIVQTDGNIAPDVTFGIKCPAGNWDYEFDTCYFLGEKGRIDFSPSVKSGSISEVAVSYDKGQSWEKLTDDGKNLYTMDIYSGNNIIRVTKDDGTVAYQIVMGDQVTLEVVEQDGNGDEIFDAGETFRVNLKGVHNTIPKMSGIYNPGFSYGVWSVYNVNGGTVKGNAGQYCYPGNANFVITLDMSKEVGYTFELRDGYVDTNVFGGATGGHRNISDTGVSSNLSAGEAVYGRAMLPDIDITVGMSFADINGSAGDSDDNKDPVDPEDPADPEKPEVVPVAGVLPENVDFGLAENQIKGYVTVSFRDNGVRSEFESENIEELYSDPMGTIIPEVKVPYKSYDTVASVTLRALNALGYKAAYVGDEFSSFYLSAIGNFDLGNSYVSSFGEFDAGSGSGWMVTWNNWFIGKGASEFIVSDGDIIEWQYTCAQGADIGSDRENPSAEITGLVFAENYGTLSPAFADKVEEYVYTVPVGTSAIALKTEMANYWAKTTITVDGREYKPMQEIPVTDGTVISIKSGYSENYGSAPLLTDKLTITVRFEKAEPVELPFTDIPDAWYQDAVRYVYENGIMNGMTETTFEPGTTLSRAMFITMLYRMEGEPSVSGKLAYSDVKSDFWYTDAIIWGTEAGIVNGYGNGIFKPEGLVTRQEMAKMMYCFAEYKGMDVTASASFENFNDGDLVAEWAAPYLGWAVAEELIKGDTLGNLNPAGNATRAEAATVIMRFDENVLK